ncbi:MAG: GNAT family N-acetyltransferase [Gammaproteobacteria bacterium]|nr:GNAT family N-acetyltransferase [Gammaproteobacteria bacterium]
MKWNTAKFHQLTPDQLYDILKLRVDIFVVEQKCPYPELDEKDRHVETRHMTAYDDSGLIAYTRLLPPGLSYPDVSVGRFAVKPSARNQGTGSLLMERTLEEIDKIWPDKAIRISAQVHLREFYEKFGFKKVSDSYLEDGIPHIEMLREQ